MMSKTTVGPWRVNGRYIEALKSKTVAEVPKGGIMHAKVDAANAMLIAASPDLLAACKAAQHVWEQGCVDRGYEDEHNWIDEAIDLIDTAIERAESGGVVRAAT